MGAEANKERAEKLYNRILEVIHNEFKMLDSSYNGVLDIHRVTILDELKEICAEIEFQDSCEKF